MTLYFACYSRVSSDEQTKGISPDDQVNRILSWSQSSALSFILAQYGSPSRQAIFYEDYTGFEYERPEMDKIRDLAKQGIINALVITKTDRFARDEAVYMLLERYFKKYNVRLFSVEEGEFTPGVVNRYVAAFQRARAEDDAYTSKKRMRDARHAYSKAGVIQSQGHALFGYTKMGAKRDTCYIINEEQATIIRQMFDWYTIHGWTVYKIMRELNNTGIPSPAVFKKMKHENLSGKWVDSTVRDILRNPAYKGKLVIYQTATMEDGQRHEIPQDEQVIVSIPYIISEEQWNLAAYKLAHSRDKWRERPKMRDYLLTGMLRCHCGAAMTGTSLINSKHGRQYFYYRCTSYKREWNRPACSSNQHVNATDVEYTVWDFIERLADDPETTIALYEEEQSAIDDKLIEARARLEAIAELLEENHQETIRLNQMYQRGRCDQDYFDAEWTRLNDEKQALLREQAKTEAITQKHTATATQLDQICEIGDDLRDDPEPSFEKKRRTLERLQVVVTAQKAPELSIEILGYQGQSVGLKKGYAR